MSAGQKELVDETIESIIGDDHARLADVMFELVKTDEHYRVLAKHRSKPDFVLRYIERLASEHQAVAAVALSQLAQAKRGELQLDDDGSGSILEDSRPCEDDFDYVGAQELVLPVAMAAALPCTDDFEYVGSPGGDGTELALTTRAAEGETAEVGMELRPRGESAAAEELESLGPQPTEEASPSAAMVELRPVGYTSEARIEEMAVEEPRRLEEMAVEEAEASLPRSRGNTLEKSEAASLRDEFLLPSPKKEASEDPAPVPPVSAGADARAGQMAQELVEIAPPVEMQDLVPGANPSPLFNPPTRGGLFANANYQEPGSFSAPSMAHNRLRKMSNQMVSDASDDGEEGDYQLSSSAGIQASRQYNPTMTKKAGGKSGDAKEFLNADPNLPSLHSGIPGNYDRNDDSGKWVVAPSTQYE